MYTARLDVLIIVTPMWNKDFCFVGTGPGMFNIPPYSWHTEKRIYGPCTYSRYFYIIFLNYGPELTFIEDTILKVAVFLPEKYYSKTAPMCNLACI